jgi:16S rRNA A1518/A1519 N6-dimethyltransferase RsmA/KsgA/DIM1 with predicted DNA glycosylase/AP lyase activity
MAIFEDPELHEIAALEAVVPSFRGCRVLEIGCGNGRLTRRYSLTTKSVIAIDPNEDAIARLAGTLPNVDARALGVDELALSPNSVDIVLFAWSL